MGPGEERRGAAREREGSRGIARKETEKTKPGQPCQPLPPPGPQGRASLESDATARGGPSPVSQTAQAASPLIPFSSPASPSQGPVPRPRTVFPRVLSPSPQRPSPPSGPVPRPRTRLPPQGPVPRLRISPRVPPPALTPYPPSQGPVPQPWTHTPLPRVPSPSVQSPAPHSHSPPRPKPAPAFPALGSQHQAPALSHFPSSAAPHLPGGSRRTSWVLDAAKPGARRRWVLKRLVVARLCALGRFRCCTVGLRGLVLRNP
ncbi:LOW QUALITY PROTEIN: hypothetical protein AAY473_004568 [Plecturocebus cupreus]